MNILRKSDLLTFSLYERGLTLQKAIEAMPLIQLEKKEGHEAVLKTVIALLVINSEYFLVNNKMSDNQAIQIASLFIEEYGYESLEDLMLCLKNAKLNRYGATYNRLDGQIIFEWFQKYLDEKYQEVEKQRKLRQVEKMEQQKEVLSGVGKQLLNGINERLEQKTKNKEQPQHPTQSDSLHWKCFQEVIARAEPEQLTELLIDYQRHAKAGNQTVQPYIEALIETLKNTQK